MNKFTIYATDTCQYCKAAKDLLTERGFPYTYKVLRTSRDIEEFQREFPGMTSVPQIILPDGRKIGGYDALLQVLG